MSVLPAAYRAKNVQVLSTINQDLTVSSTQPLEHDHTKINDHDTTFDQDDGTDLVSYNHNGAIYPTPPTDTYIPNNTPHVPPDNKKVPVSTATTDLLSDTNIDATSAATIVVQPCLLADDNASLHRASTDPASMLTNSRDTTDEDTGDFSPASNDSSLSMIDLQPSIGKDADHMDTNSAKTTSPIPNQHVYYTDSEW
eukprot:CAMPEP_0201215394 /NCGR_PEP_ID=MMETSP0851-20130426/188940_1 /ASSEMBLY_ACC=CAM_ASM_000631 /TAXON_ID=183588 /ORGANISM="Pseudo-nitzschia fraudulenta, Strain WWA7" /LENGTH=196 /DNA_ID=CAMNT_0047504849 /DNA_START=286 /DNA_END=872 /DNA_ORIENTATION=-